MMDEKQLKKNIKNLKTCFQYLLSTIDDEKSMEYNNLVFEKFKRVVDIRKFKSICIYDNFDNELLVHNIIKYANDNNIKVSILNDKLSSPKLVESFETYKQERESLFKNSKTTSIKSAKMIITSGLIFDEGSYFMAHKNLAKAFSKNDKALRVAMSYDFQIIPRIEMPESNEIIDMIITEGRVVSVNRLGN